MFKKISELKLWKKAVLAVAALLVLAILGKRYLTNLFYASIQKNVIKDVVIYAGRKVVVTSGSCGKKFKINI